MFVSRAERAAVSESGVARRPFELRPENLRVIRSPKLDPMPDSPSSRARLSPIEIIGQMAGEYRLGRLLGEGGFGAVYEAEHPLLKRRAAVKVLHRAGEIESDAVQRFIGEAQAVNQIKSRHIVDVFSFGTLADGRYFYVMDFLEGEPLDHYLKRRQRVDVDSALQILQPIADALDSAHKSGIIHRDIKPQNIFLARDGADGFVPKLLDFGMAKLMAASPVRTVSGTPIGTPLYMSPEQARGDKVDARCDIYSLGVVCYEMLVGQVPFDAETTVTVLMAHLMQAPEPPSEACAALPPEFDAPLLAMLNKDPEGRPASAGAALAALRAAAEQAGITLSLAPPSLLPVAPSGERAKFEPGLDVRTTVRATHVSVASGSIKRARASRRLWLAGTGMLGLGAALTFWLGRPEHAAESGALPEHRASTNSSAGANAPSPVPSTPALVAAPAASLPAVSSSASAAPVVSTVASSEKRPSADPHAKKRHTALASPSAIPRDLESPFGP
jgi:serine/threonine-protein kinase